ncbi:MAG: lamin tail domain-containing protein, partial [Verrucomicrobia bacterium]|nr:lamin tail domain-containing protein [Verrucomicrobiota bacterium]
MTIRFPLACVFIACFSVSSFGQLIISEFMADNESVLQDEDADYSDWIEIHNTSASPVDLAGWHLTDSADDLTKWTFPSTNVAADGFCMVFASGKDRTTPGQELHTSFNLDAGGEFLALVAPDGTNVVSSYSPPRQFGDVSYGLQTHGTAPNLRPGATGYLIERTPGDANTVWPAPHPIYCDQSVARIDIFIRQEDWNDLKYGSSEESMVFRFRHGDVDVTLTNVTMRRRGNTSYDQLPRSFQVSFNSLVPGQDLFDMEKLNLNAEVNDPTMARSKLVNDVVLAAGLPGSYANHTALVVHFTNGNHAVWFDSLHNNTQPVDDVLMEQRYGTSAANLYKCLYNQWPADLTYRGPDGSSYIGNGTTYALKYPGGADSTYDDLADFIDLINNTSSNDFPNAIMSRFEVDAFLKRMAVDVLTGNWDDHWQLHNNYYLFDNPTRDRWTMIPYDFDNTFGIDWIGDDWGTKNIYNFGNNSQSVNPLISRTFSVPGLKDRYSYYMKEFLDAFYTKSNLVRRAYAIRDTLTAPLPFGSPSISNMKSADRTNYSYAWPQWNYSDFYDGYDAPRTRWVPPENHVPDDYGLTPFFGVRITNALAQLEITNIAPVISDFSFEPGLPRIGDPIHIAADAFDDVAVTSVVFWYEFDGGGYTNVQLSADSDGQYGTSLPAFTTNGSLTYFLAASDDTGATTYEPFGGPTYAYSLQIDSPSLNLVITELNYHPHDPEGSELGVSTDEDDYEFIELRNTGSSALQLAGFELADAVSFIFPTNSLAPGAFVLVVRDDDAFEARYGTTNPVVGEYGGKFSDSGETLRLLDPQGRELVAFEYSDSGAWPGRSDGNGSALEVIDTRGDYSDADNWRSSSEYGGTPGYAGLGPDNRIVVNEILTHTDPPLVDAVELFNTTESAIDIGGWFLSDDSARYRKYRIPPSTVIAGKAYRVFDETNHFNTSMGVDSNDFAFSGAHGDDVWLMEANAESNLVRFVDHAQFGAARNGESFGRWPNGIGTPYPMISRTLSSSNSGPRIGPLLITEVMYNPSSGNADHEYIEIYNPGLTSTNLNNWQLSDGVDYTFTNTMIGPTGLIVVITFDPTLPANAARLSDFRSTYSIGANVLLVGGFDGQLNNAGERVRLFRPDDPPAEEPTFIPLLLEDEVEYDEIAPWPTAPDGHGPSLSRLVPPRWGDDPYSWFSGNASPGSINLSTDLVTLTISSAHGT